MIHENHIELCEKQIRDLFLGNVGFDWGVQNNDENATENARIFREAVRKGTSQPYDEMLEGYLAGEKYVPENDSDENVFQLAVLAEALNVRGTKSSDTLQYTMRAAYYFTEFATRGKEAQIGLGETISKEIVSFRIGKMYLREAGKGIYEEEFVNSKKHLLLNSYSYFNYSLRNLSCEDKMYLVILYYRGLTLLDMLPYISDENLILRLCEKELGAWNELQKIRDKETYSSVYEMEQKTLQDIMDVPELLQIYYEDTMR